MSLIKLADNVLPLFHGQVTPYPLCLTYFKWHFTIRLPPFIVK